MFDKFKAAAEAAGNTEVQRFSTKAEALHFIEGFLKKEEIKDAPGSYAVWADAAILKGVDTKDLAAKIPCNPRPGKKCKDRHYPNGVGIGEYGDAGAGLYCG